MGSLAIPKWRSFLCSDEEPNRPPKPNRPLGPHPGNAVWIVWLWTAVDKLSFDRSEPPGLIRFRELLGSHSFEMFLLVVSVFSALIPRCIPYFFQDSGFLDSKRWFFETCCNQKQPVGECWFCILLLYLVLCGRVSFFFSRVSCSVNLLWGPIRPTPSACSSFV